VFLIGIGALAALKVSIGRPEKQQVAFGDVVIEVSENALAKTDKLDIERYFRQEDHTTNCNCIGGSRADTENEDGQPPMA
jgi:hypothetical protein